MRRHAEQWQRRKGVFIRMGKGEKVRLPIVTWLLLAALAGAEVVTSPARLTKEQQLTFEVIALKLQLLQQQAEALRAEQSALVLAVCAAAKIPKDSCSVNWRDNLIENSKPQPKEK